MGLRRISRVSGFVHDIDHLSALSGDCNLVLLTDRALYVLQNLAGEDVTFSSRYGHIVDGDQYTPIVLDGGTDEQLYQQTIYEIQGGLGMGCLEDLIGAITAAAEAVSAAQSACCETSIEATGQYSEPDESTGAPETEPPPGYGETPLTLSQKCQMSNYYYRQAISCFRALDDYNVLGWLAIGIAALSTQILAVLGAVLGASMFSLLFSQFGTLSLIMETMQNVSLDSLGDIGDAIEADEAGFVCALYTSDDIGSARENVQDWAQTAGLTATEAFLLVTVLNPYVMSGLFFPSTTALAEAAEITDPYDCAQCGIQSGIWQIVPQPLGGGGTLIEESETYIIVESVVGTDTNQRVGVLVNWDIPGEVSIGDEWTVEATIVGGAYTYISPGVSRWVGDALPLTQVWGDNHFWTGFACTRQIVAVSTTTFQVKFQLSAAC